MASSNQRQVVTPFSPGLGLASFPRKGTKREVGRDATGDGTVSKAQLAEMLREDVAKQEGIIAAGARGRELRAAQDHLAMSRKQLAKIAAANEVAS